jgi:putative membrane protein
MRIDHGIGRRTLVGGHGLAASSGFAVGILRVGASAVDRAGGPCYRLPSPGERSGGCAMKLLTTVVLAFVALSHLGFLVIEMFFWDHPFGRKTFGMTPEVSASSAVLAAIQGLYNGFLAAGVAWAIWSDRRDLKLFFIGCVVIAGIFGGFTSILFTQALPAAIGLALVSLARKPAAT